MRRRVPRRSCPTLHDGSTQSTEERKMPEISSSSPRALSIAHTPAETKASDPAQQAEIRGGQLQVHADVASDNIHPHERPSPPASSQAASQAAPSSVTAVRPGLKPSAATLATLALPNQASPNNLRAHSAVGFNAFNTRARSPSSRSRDIPNRQSAVHAQARSPVRIWTARVNNPCHSITGTSRRKSHPRGSLHQRHQRHPPYRHRARP